MKVAIIGSALSGNRGAAAMLEAAVQRLTERHPDVDITHLSMYPKADARLSSHANVTVLDASPLRLGVLLNSAALVTRILPFLRGPVDRAVPEVAALREADVLLDQGGITFVDGREKFLVYNVASILPALNTRTPVVKCAQALGPFQHTLNRWAARVYLPRVAAIVSRGAITHEHLEGLGLTNVERGADIAFTLEVTDADRAAAAAAVDGGFFDGGDVVGYSPSQVLRAAAERAGQDYVAEAAAHIDAITTELGRPVLVVAHSYRPDATKLHNNDAPVCRDIVARVARPEMVHFADAELSPGALRVLIGQCDAFVASRFHAMVSSLATGVPTLVLGWSHKYREVLEMFGQEQWALAADAVDTDVVTARLRDLLAGRDAVASEISEALPRVREAAMGQFDVIDRIAAG